MRKHLLLFVLIIISLLQTHLLAENYKAAAALRAEAGEDGNHGLDYKYFLSEHTGLEGMALTDFDNGIEFHLFYLYQNVFPGAPENVQWYAGLGWHIGFWGEDDDFVTGPDGLVGAEYIFEELPLSFSLDWHPLVNIISEKDQKFWPMKFGVSIRYYF